MKPAHTFRNVFASLSLLLGSFSPFSAHAASVLDFNLIDPTNLNGALPQNVVDEAVKLYALWGVHRPYSGATSIYSSNGFDFLLETTMVKLPDSLGKALTANGITFDSSKYSAAVPQAVLNLRKAFGPSFDLGISGLYYRGQTMAGTDLKFVLHDEEEGPSFAFRLGYTYINAPYVYIKNCSVIAPEFVMSRKLMFAEPYIGIGGRIYRGTVSIPFAGSPPIIPAFTLNKDSSGFDAYSFTGVYFRILGAQGLRMGIEGSFSLKGFHTIGSVFGFGF